MMIGRGKKQKRLSEINITPLVDVMLVLMIIFLVTAPMINYTIDINLPSAKTTQKLENKKINLSLQVNGNLYWGKKLITNDELILQIKSLSSTDTIYFAADKDVKYEKITQILNIFSSNAITNIVLVTGE